MLDSMNQILPVFLEIVFADGKIEKENSNTKGAVASGNWGCGAFGIL